MGEEKNDAKETKKRNWLDYFDVFKYFIPFFVYFIVIWLDSNYASDEDLSDVRSSISDNTILVQRAIENNKDLENKLFYEIRLIDTKLSSISENIEEVKKIVEEEHKND